MVQLGQLVLSLLPLAFWAEQQLPITDPHDIPHPHSGFTRPADATTTKSIAIVGAGSGGLAALKSILDLPPETRAGWEVVLYEQRRDVGGVWLPDPPGPLPTPPDLPESPLYPRLHTNTPHPAMTYRNFTFPPGTPLLPRWDAVQQYYTDYAVHYGLNEYIHLNHTVISTQWHGDDKEGDWHVEVHARGGNDGRKVVLKRTFDHLIVATGNDHYPKIPTWNGTATWLAGTRPGRPARQIEHSIYYRDPEVYADKTVVIVGGGPSARDIAIQIGPIAKVIYQSLQSDSVPIPGRTIIPKPLISHFTRDAVVFQDGSVLRDVDAVLLGTGYELRMPFLCSPHASVMDTDPYTRANSSTARKLTSNLRYVFPLHRHIFSIAPDVPTTALAFIGLPVFIANAPSDTAQGIFVAHVIANASLLPPRDAMMQELLEHEATVRANGPDLYRVGYRLIGDNTEEQDYQDQLIEDLKKQGALPNDGKKFAEDWRRMARLNWIRLAQAWWRVEELGEEARWLEGMETESEWADMMHRLADWQRDWEKEHGRVDITGAFNAEY
ncbi:uncharacterized protein FIBRA_07732 [Fibroporia radiculosa]|uniref:FAD/NAD(P)-binding domain-containing protein n=1 Tax=Fibroporia radiculosa TaxID=599839 RepID=J4H4S7_9APHY|nr:uncharacterized protein FIBRA_07732 [Fibroporia radiculosa]CCM05509.1 predicted protein [Fibroporia radiculosa]